MLWALRASRAPRTARLTAPPPARCAEPGSKRTSRPIIEKALTRSRPPTPTRGAGPPTQGVIQVGRPDRRAQYSLLRCSADTDAPGTRARVSRGRRDRDRDHRQPGHLRKIKASAEPAADLSNDAARRARRSRGLARQLRLKDAELLLTRNRRPRLTRSHATRAETGVASGRPDTGPRAGIGGRDGCAQVPHTPKRDVGETAPRTARSVAQPRRDDSRRTTARRGYVVRVKPGASRTRDLGYGGRRASCSRTWATSRIWACSRVLSTARRRRSAPVIAQRQASRACRSRRRGAARGVISPRRGQGSRLTDPAQPSLRFNPHGRVWRPTSRFAGDDLWLVGRHERDIRNSWGWTAPPMRFLALPDLAQMGDFDPGRPRARAWRTTGGQAWIVDGFPLRGRRRVEAVPRPARRRPVHPRPGAASPMPAGRHDRDLALEHGAVTPRAQLAGHADRVATSAGRREYVIAAGGNAP